MQNRTSYRGLLLFICLFLDLALYLAGQGTSGSFTGTVSDATGAVIQGASVTATSVDSGRTWRTQANDVGIYNLPSVPPGVYTLAIEAAGFKRLATNSITLELSIILQILITLTIFY